MPLYTYRCSICSQIQEVIKSMSDYSVPVHCSKSMVRDYHADLISNTGHDYNKPIHSDSLAITPSQIVEHKQLFPDIKIDNQCRPVFENYQQHDSYLKKTGFVKMPKTVKNRGVRIA